MRVYDVIVLFSLASNLFVSFLLFLSFLMLFVAGMSLECRQRLGLSFGNHYDSSCPSPDSESSSPTDPYMPDLHNVYSDLKRKNASWNESYPDPSCCSPATCTSAAPHNNTKATASASGETSPAASGAPLPSVCSKIQKVTFSEELVAEQTFEDDEESKASRIGCWTIDAERFRNRIKDTEFIMAPVLHSDHRQKVYQRLFCCHTGHTSSTESQPSPTSSDAIPTLTDDPAADDEEGGEKSCTGGGSVCC